MEEQTPTPQLEEQEVQEAVEETPVTESPESIESENEDGVDLVKSDRGQKRIQELANKAKKTEDLEKELESLKDRLDPQQDKRASGDVLEQLQADGIPYTGDYIKDLQIAENRATEKAIRAFEKKQSFKESFNRDVSSLEETYPELRKGSEQFDEDLTHDIVTLYKNSSQSNPNLKLKPFIESVMKVRRQGENKGKSVSVQDLVNQENQGAIRPSGNIKRVNRDPADMTLEEMEASFPDELTVYPRH